MRTFDDYALGCGYEDGSAAYVVAEASWYACMVEYDGLVVDWLDGNPCEEGRYLVELERGGYRWYDFGWWSHGGWMLAVCGVVLRWARLR